MYKLCKTEQSVKRQREIEAALLTMMKETDYSSISITDLCARIPMPRKAFYRYFDTKDDALDALLMHTLAEYQGFHNGTPPKQRSLVSELEEYFKFWLEKRDFLDAFAKSNILGRLIETSIHYPVGDMISVAKFLPDEVEDMRGQIFRFAICGLSLMMIDWYRGGYAQSASFMAKAACRMLSVPLFPALSELGFQDKIQ